MNWIIAFLIKRGLSDKLAGILGPGIAYVVAALLLWGAYGLWHHKVYVEGYNAAEAIWLPRWEKHIAEDAAANIAAGIIQRQRQDELDAAKKRNTEILNAYTAKIIEATQLKRDRDLARRLLAAASKAATAPGGGDMSEAGGVGGTHEAGAPGGAGEIEDALTAALTEMRKNADQLDALRAQIGPQVTIE